MECIELTEYKPPPHTHTQGYCLWNENPFEIHIGPVYKELFTVLGCSNGAVVNRQEGVKNIKDTVI